MDAAVWNHAVYVKNRERLLNEEIAESFFKRVLERAKPYMSDEHFTVDGTLIEAWASHKSFRPKDGAGKPPGAGGDVDFRGEKRPSIARTSSMRSCLARSSFSCLSRSAFSLSAILIIPAMHLGNCSSSLALSRSRQTFCGLPE